MVLGFQIGLATTLTRLKHISIMISQCFADLIKKLSDIVNKNRKIKIKKINRQNECFQGKKISWMNKKIL